MNKNEIISHFRGNFEPFYRKYLPNVSKNGGSEFKALCPFHDEKEPSFNFNKDTGQYYCHGCRKKGDAIHFYGKLNGLDTKQDFGKILWGIAKDFGIPDTETTGTKHHEPSKTQGAIAATYDYTDEQGNILFQVCRMEPKDFTQRKPDGKGGWIFSTKGVRRVLYHLPEVLQSPQVIIVEGEKDVDSLRTMGFVATCNPGGAGKWSDEYTKALEG
ncbi:MAG: CHC2 zinc finger domain-containing protein, partial [Desulfomonilia bacterium]|nr:CHC2 zinc finger domain-containing protein [Desulfomonilia bacterium]